MKWTIRGYSFHLYEKIQASTMETDIFDAKYILPPHEDVL